MFAQITKAVTSKEVTTVLAIAAKGALAAVVVWAVGRYNIKL